MLDAFLTNCRLADGRVVDIGIADGKIAIVGEGATPTSSKSAPELDFVSDPEATVIAGGQSLMPVLASGWRLRRGRAGP
jgi:hypothetical protein